MPRRRECGGIKTPEGLFPSHIVAPPKRSQQIVIGPHIGMFTDTGQKASGLADAVEYPATMSYFGRISISEILEELPKLARSEREKLLLRLEELEAAEIEETPEMLAAIDAGRRSIDAGKTHTVDEARRLISKWTTKSS
jgi:predicted transcriptional regulator